MKARDFDARKLWAPISKSRGCAGDASAPTAWRLEQPLDLEIGAGVGWRALQYAREHPERALIAIEKTSSKFARFERRLRAHAVAENLLPVHADAIPWICARLAPRSISRCFLFYPNPCAKNPAGRWFRMPFMARLLETLKSGGEIWLATNLRWYAEEAVAEARRSWSLEIAKDRLLGPLDQPRTHFERKYLAKGETCREIVFQTPG